MSATPPTIRAGTKYELRTWLDPKDVTKVEYARYWNDENVERGKEWWILDGDFERMEHHLVSSGLLEQLNVTLDAAEQIRGRAIAGEGADLAAGSLWAVPHLLRAGAVERIYAVEFSHHRLEKLGPAVLEHYGVSPGRAVLCFGSFYELDLPDGCLDFVFMSQALHHADQPVRLLEEAGRVLAPDGVVLIIGEPFVDQQWIRLWMKHLLKAFVARGVPKRVQRTVLGRALEVSGWAPPETLSHEATLGDHHYSTPAYSRMFRRSGFTAKRLVSRRYRQQAFVLRRT